VSLPTDEQAMQFAIMVQAGLPPSEAICYFADTNEPAEVNALLVSWQKSRAVRRATAILLKKPWQDMTLDERIRLALDHTYSQMAYLLFSKHYGEVGQADKSKLDTARQALEAKLAGTAGKGDALSQFFADIKEGKLILNKPIKPLTN
jgi:hypothetical protein